MIILHQTPPAWDLPNISPFCVKLETYLRMSKIEYKTGKADILKAPNGRIPYVAIDGKIFGDSTLIIQHLKDKFGDDLDANLTKEQKALGLLIQRLIENHFYYALVWMRWSNRTSFKYVYDYFKKLLPPVVGGAIVSLIRRDILKNVANQGMGEHNEKEIIEFAQNDIKALSDILSDKKYFLGDKASSVDATVYGFLIQVLWVPWENPVKAYGLSFNNLVAFCERMKKAYWS